MSWSRLHHSAIASLQTFFLIGSCFYGMMQSQPSVAKTPIFSKNALQTLGITDKQSSNTKPTGTNGQFRLVYEPSDVEENQTLQQALKESGLFETIVGELNSMGLMLPEDITLVVGDCQEANAYYDASTKQIKMCHELITSTNRDFYGPEDGKRQTTAEEAAENALNTTVFVFYHELGHALIDVLNLPTTGREEDVVDEFATILLVNTNKPQAANIVLSAAKWFGLPTNAQVPAWEEHSPNEQRVYNILCYVYGSGPQQYQFLLEQTELPQYRASSCVAEYEKKVSSWNQLLQPHMAQGYSFIQHRGNSSSRPLPPQRGGMR
jgi:hypothetical protein